MLDGDFAIRTSAWSGPGGVVRAPLGTVLGFGNAGTAPATLQLLISSEGGHEDNFRGLAAILAERALPDTAAISAPRKRFDMV